MNYTRIRLCSYRYIALFDISIYNFCFLILNCCQICFKYIKAKKKKMLLQTSGQWPGWKKRNETNFPDGRIQAFSSFSASFEPFIKNDFTSWGKKIQILSGEWTIGKLEFGETYTQRCFQSLYLTCLEAKKLLEHFTKYIEFPVVPFISQLSSLVKYIFWNLVAKWNFFNKLSVSTSVDTPNGLYISTCLLYLLNYWIFSN